MTSETIKTEDDAVKFARLDIWASFGEFKLTTLKLHLRENGKMSKSQVIRVRHLCSEPQGRLLKLQNATEGGEQGSPEAPLAKDPPSRVPPPLPTPINVGGGLDFETCHGEKNLRREGC